jgi:hypothetical protein
MLLCGEKGVEDPYRNGFLGLCSIVVRGATLYLDRKKLKNSHNGIECKTSY